MLAERKQNDMHVYILRKKKVNSTKRGCDAIGGKTTTNKEKNTTTKHVGDVSRIHSIKHQKICISGGIKILFLFTCKHTAIVREFKICGIFHKYLM